MSTESRREFKRQFDSGEITVDEYIYILERSFFDERKGNLPKLSFEGINIYDDFLVISGDLHKYDEIAHIDGASVNISMNLFPIIRKTELKIFFSNGSSFQMKEERLFFGNNRHKMISQATHLLKKITFESIFDTLCEDVRTRMVQIGIQSDSPMGTIMGSTLNAISLNIPSIIYLSRDAFITNGSLTLDLKKCRREGVLELGIFRTNTSEPECVYACASKGIMERGHKHALRFFINGKYRSDAVKSLLNWMANPGNCL